MTPGLDHAQQAPDREDAAARLPLRVVVSPTAVLVVSPGTLAGAYEGTPLAGWRFGTWSEEDAEPEPSREEIAAAVSAALGCSLEAPEVLPGKGGNPQFRFRKRQEGGVR